MWNWIRNIPLFKREQIRVSRRAVGYSSGIHINEDTAMKASAYHRGVIYVSTQIAKLPWYVKAKDNTVLVNHPLQYLLNVSPNGEMTAMDFKLCMIQNAIHHGNAYAEIERDLTGRPVALWPITSNLVEPFRTPDGKLVYRVVGGSTAVSGTDAYLKPKDVYHLKNFHTKDGIVGQSLIGYMADSLGINLGADRMAGSLFENGGLPSGVLEVTGELSEEAYERVKKSWKEQHSGKRAGGVAILEDGAKYTPLSMSPDVLQFLESRKFGVVEIARFLGLPPTKLFDTDATTFNNIENSNLEVATDTLHAWAKRCETEADMKLLNGQYAGIRTEMDLYEIFRGDMTTRSNYFSKMMQVAAITPNEIRQLEGRAPYKEGARFFVAVNNLSPADRIDEIIDADIASGKGNSNGGGDNKNQTDLTVAVTRYLEK